MDKVKSFLDTKGTILAKAIKESCIQLIANYLMMTLDGNVLDTMPPDSKNIHVDSLKADWKSCCRKYHATKMPINLNDSNN